MATFECSHDARQAFIEAENSEKLKRALRHNVRTANDAMLIETKFTTSAEVIPNGDAQLLFSDKMGNKSYSSMVAFTSVLTDVVFNM